MTEITVTKGLILILIFLLMWSFLWGVYLQATYDIGHIPIPVDENLIYGIIGGVIVGSLMRLYDEYKGV